LNTSRIIRQLLKISKRIVNNMTD